MTTAVERNDQMRRLITFFAGSLQTFTHKKLENNCYNKRKYKNEFHFSKVHRSMNAVDSVQS